MDYRQQNSQRSLIVKGNTFPIKDALKRLGCRWEPIGKNWIAPDPAVLTAAYRALDDHEAAAKLARLSPDQIIDQGGKTRRGQDIELVRNRRQPPPIGALVEHPEHGLMLVVKTGECFLDESAGPEAWRCRYTAAPVQDRAPAAAA